MSKGTPVKTTDYQFADLPPWGGLNKRDSKYMLPPGMLTECMNMEVFPDGWAKRVEGYSNKLDLGNNTAVRNFFQFYDEAATEHIVFTVGDELRRLNTSTWTSAEFVNSGATSAWNGGTSHQKVQMQAYVGRMFLGNGTDNGIKVVYDGSGDRTAVTNWVVKNWGLTGPAAAATVAVGDGTGLTGTYKMVYTYYNANDGTESAPSAAQTAVSPSNQDIDITTVASSDSQVTAIRLYLTTNGGSIYYFHSAVANASDTYTVSTEATGSALATTGYAPPPQSNIFILFNNRMWVVDADNPYRLMWSENGLLGAANLEYFQTTSFFDFDTPVTGLAKTSHGILVMEEAKTTLLAGDTPSQMIPKNLSESIGCASSKSVAYYNQLPVWCDRNSVYYYDGGSIQDVGNAEASPIRETFKSDKKTDAVGIVDPVEGKYYLWTAASGTTADATTGIFEPSKAWVFNFNTGFWHQRDTQNFASATWEVTNQRIICGGASDDLVYLLNDTAIAEPATFAGTSINAYIQTAYLDFQSWGYKQLREFMCELQSRGNLTLTVYGDSSSGTAYTMTIGSTDQTNYNFHRLLTALGVRNNESQAFKVSFKIANVASGTYCECQIGRCAVRIKERPIN